MRIRIAARNGAIDIENGRIAEASPVPDLVLNFPDADVRPGLINAHDHLHRNHYGRLGGPRYRNAYDWAADIQRRYRRRIGKRRRKARREALLAGAWKNLFAGVTAVVHHDPWEPAFDDGFPIRVLRLRCADSLGMDADLDDLSAAGRFALHLAEGTDGIAAAEVGLLAAKGLLTRRLIAVHGVGLDEHGIVRFRDAGAALIWCPTSNVFLFGRTAPAELLRDGIDVLLGSDSRLTGAGDLLDELRFARACGLVSADRLESAVGEVAARRLGIVSPTLRPGAPADLVVLARPLLESCAEDVRLVMVGGTPRVARPDLASMLESHGFVGDEMRIGPVVRWASSRPAMS